MVLLNIHVIILKELIGFLISTSIIFLGFRTIIVKSTLRNQLIAIGSKFTLCQLSIARWYSSRIEIRGLASRENGLALILTTRRLLHHPIHLVTVIQADHVRFDIFGLCLVFRALVRLNVLYQFNSALCQLKVTF